MEEVVADLVEFLEMFQERGPAPILWVGAGASAAAGHPTLWQLQELLRKRVKKSTKEGFALIDEFVAKWGETALTSEMETHFGKPRAFVGLHASMARLAGAGLFRAIFTTNYDELVEDALKAAGVRYVPETLQLNYRLQERKDLLLLKLHGSRTDWASVVLSRASYDAFQASYPLLRNQLDLNLRTRPLLFVGCSMQDPRVLDWLRALPEDQRRGQFPGRVLITRNDWAKLSDEERALLESATIRPILVETHSEIATVLAAAAAKLA